MKGKEKRMINIYSCGGTGVNIGKKLIDDLDLNVYFIDSSISNMKEVKENIFIVENMDGAGKHRATTYHKAKEDVLNALIKFKPSDTLNIVISSLSGGTGSVVAPLIVKKLTEDGKNVVVIGIDSQTSIIELENSVKTLKSYKGVSDTTKKPVILYYIENTKRNEADKKAVSLINLFSVITDKSSTEEFDVADLTNFLHFNEVTEVNPSLGILEINENEEYIPEKGTHVVSSILVTKSPDNTIKEPIPDYLSTCLVVDKDFTLDNFRLDVVLGKSISIISKLEEKLSNLIDQRKVNKFKDIDVETNTEEGICI